MDIRAVDLNLLVVFDAMVEHQGVSRAAEAVGLSQPAMSAAVARLRVLFGDPLFVKVGLRMQPTPRAVELAVPIRRVVETVRNEVLQAARFEPSTTSHLFSIVTPDIGEAKFLPPILARFAVDAPSAGLRTLSMPRHAAAEALESGRAELAIGYFPDLHKAGFFQQKLFANGYVCIVRGDHPEIGSTLTRAQYLAASHAVVRPEGREHLLEQVLEAQGLRRRVAIELAHFMTLLPIIAGSDLLATVPRDLAEVLARYADLRLLEAPIALPVIDVRQFWHRRFHKDPANVWLRGMVQALFGNRPAPAAG